jgi:hypothetical protein
MTGDTDFGRFVAVANGRYRRLESLTNAVGDTDALAELLGELGLSPTIFPNKTESQIRTGLRRALKPAEHGDSLIVLWTGHGKQGADGSLRLYARSSDGDAEVLDGALLGELAAQTTCREIIVIVDACFSGAGLVEAAAAANAVRGALRDPENGWFCVVAACLSDEPARAGAVAREIRRLLTEAPTDPADRERFSSRNSTIRGDDFVAALKRNWAEPRQHPQLIRLGASERPLMRNPFYRKTRVSSVVEHLRIAARGTSADDGNFFTGRQQALRTLVGALSTTKHGVIIVTGPAGCGKSAVVGRLASLSDAGERAMILADEASLPEGTDPGPGSILANVHVRGMDAVLAFAAIGEQVSLPSGSSRYDVLAHLSNLPAESPKTIIVDGLDEVGPYADIQRFAAEFIAPISREALVIVSSRSITSAERASADMTALFGPLTLLIDLGDDPNSERDLHEYVERRLTGVDNAMDPKRVADAFIGRQEKGIDDAGTFLLARLVTSQLRSTPVDTSLAIIELASTVDEALEADLRSTILTIDDKPHPTAARELLGALSFAHGSGFTVDIWSIAAAAASPSKTAYKRDDVFELLAALGRHVVTEEAGGVAVYRMAHRALRDCLRTSATSGTEMRVFDALTAEYIRLLERGDAASETGYLWSQYWRHAVEAGDHGIEVLRDFVARDRGFVIDLGLALSSGSTKMEDGDIAGASSQLEEAAEIFRELGESDRLRWVLVNLTGLYAIQLQNSKLQSAVREITLSFRGEDDMQGRVTVALALTSAALAQRLRGKPDAALRLADEALTLLGYTSAESMLEESGESENAFVAGLALQQKAMSLLQFDATAASSVAKDSLRLVDSAVDSSDSLILPDILSVVCITAVAAGDTDTADAALARLTAWDATDSISSSLVAIPLASALLLQARRSMQTKPEETTAESLLATIHRVDELVQPFVETLPSALIFRAEAWISAIETRLVNVEEANDLVEDLDRQLRERVDDLGIAPEMLGRLYTAIALTKTDIAERQAAAEEATLWFDQVETPTSIGTFCNAYSVALTVFPAASPVHINARRSLIRSANLWRRLTPGGETALLGLRSDEVWALAQDGRTYEAGALAAVASAEAGELDQRDPGVALQLAALCINASVLSLYGRDLAAARRELLRSIKLLRNRDEDDVTRRIRATAYINLAAVANQRGRPNRAFAYLETARPLLTDAEPDLMVRLLLNEARATEELGDSVTAARLSQTAIDQLMQDLDSNPTLLVVLGEALNQAGDAAWREAELLLKDGPMWPDVRLLRQPIGSTPADTARYLARLLGDAQSRLEETGVKQVVRLRRRDAPQEFDEGWTAATGEHPSWLEFDPAHFERVIAWLNTASWRQSREFLRDHPSLQTAVTGQMLDELDTHDATPAQEGSADPSGDSDSDTGSDTSISIHQQLLADSMSIGVDDAYAPMVGFEVVNEWIQSNFSSETYEAVRADLRNDRALDDADLFDDDARSILLAAFELIDRGEMSLALDALHDDFRRDWSEILSVAQRSQDIPRFVAVATLAGPVSDDPVEMREITAARVLAATLTDRVEAAVATIQEADSPEVRVAIERALVDGIADHREHTSALVAALECLRAGQ